MKPNEAWKYAGEQLWKQYSYAILKIKVILSLFDDARIQIRWISCNMLQGQHIVAKAELFRENELVTRGKLSLEPAPASCSYNMVSCVRQPYRVFQ